MKNLHVCSAVCLNIDVKNICRFESRRCFLCIFYHSPLTWCFSESIRWKKKKKEGEIIFHKREETSEWERSGVETKCIGIVERERAISRSRVCYFIKRQRSRLKLTDYDYVYRAGPRLFFFISTTSNHLRRGAARLLHVG